LGTDKFEHSIIDIVVIVAVAIAIAIDEISLHPVLN
jgi:hypothetical protein